MPRTKQPRRSCVGERVTVRFGENRGIKALVKKVGSWFVRFRRWARTEDLHYTALGSGEWITIDNLGPKRSRERRRRIKKLRE